jgi:hypothetical protein
MRELVALSTSEAAVRLRAAGEAARGFLGVDPVTQNDPLLVRELDAQQAQLFACGQSVAGYLSGADNPRQATVAAAGDDPQALAALTEFLHRYRRYTSFVATAEPDSAAARALLGCGFTEVGRLTGHLFRAGRYRDAGLYYATWETACAR